MTVLEAIQRSTEFLAKKGVESARLQAELLLAHALGIPRLKLYLNFERTLAPAEVDAFRDMIKRRGQREPLQHIVGSTSFCDLEIVVNRHVLVPRPETELLAERAWQFLIQLSSTNHQACTALDFGTGSGCLAVTLAVKCPAAVISGIDISPEALEVARDNARRHGVAERVCLLQGDGFAALTAPERFDLIVSNPPYILSDEIATLEPEVRDYDPRQALDGGPDGLGFHRRLAAEAGTFLKPGGALMLEFGDGQAPSIQRILEEQKWVVESVLSDYTQRLRILVAHRD